MRRAGTQPPPPTLKRALAIGAIWVVLTLIFEFSLGQAFGMTWPRMLEDYDLTRGGLMGFGVTAMFCIPWVVNRWRKEKH